MFLIERQWNLDSGFYSLVDFQFFQLCFAFLSPGFRIPQAKISQIPESVFPYIGRLVLISRASPLTVSLCFLFCSCLFVFCRALKQNKELKGKTEELEKRFITMVHLQLLHSKVCLGNSFPYNMCRTNIVF